MKNILFIFLAIIALAIGCDSGSDDSGNMNVEDDYNRKAMLTDWADNIIIPGFEDLLNKAQSLKEAVQTFSNDPTMDNLNAVRTAWLTANLAWQRVPMFLYKKGDEIGLRQQMNIYPVDVEAVEKNISKGSYNLELPATIDQQGFPTLDYLLHGLGGLGSSDDDILDHYTSNSNEAAYRQYLVDVASRIHELVNIVYEEWTQNGFRDEFVNNDGNSTNSSVNRVVNDFIFSYEKDLRANKVGIPAGIWTSTPFSNLVEGYYKQDISKTLLLAALDASQDFFNGVYNGSSPGQSGECLKTYLDYLQATKNDVALSSLINDQFDTARNEINSKLGENFIEEIENSNGDMIDVYNQLQLNVVLLKTDMYEAIGVARDFVDSDGD